MSAVYTNKAFAKLVGNNMKLVTDWITENPGKSVDECATATSVPYEVVFQIISQSDMVLLPSASGEIQFGPGRGLRH